MERQERLMELRSQWVSACECYLHELFTMWESSKNYGYWVGNQVGGVYCLDDYIFINMEDIIYIVENAIPRHTYLDFIEYCQWCSQYAFTTPNFRSYVNGCPTIPSDVRDKLDKQKSDFEKLVMETKKDFESGKF